MVRQQRSSLNLFWAIGVSSFVALVLTILPVPQMMFYFWPEWIPLVVIYWALSVPDRVGPWIAFAIGTLLEVLFVRNFGVLGFGMAFLAFLVNRAHQQLRAISVWQQTLLVGIFIGLFKLVTGWLYGLVSDFTITTEYWYSIVGSIIFWPFVFILLQELRRMARVS